MTARQYSDDAGFTLPELIIAVAVAAILLAGALPGMSDLVQGNRQSAARTAFLTALAFAKQAAITRNTDVALCPSADGRHCLPHSRWHKGWIVFTDPEENREPGGPATILRVHPPLEHGITLTSSEYRRVIAFQPLGSAAGSNATFTFCDQLADTPPRVVVLSNAGRVRWQRAPESAACY